MGVTGRLLWMLQAGCCGCYTEAAVTLPCVPLLQKECFQIQSFQPNKHQTPWHQAQVRPCRMVSRYFISICHKPVSWAPR